MLLPRGWLGSHSALDPDASATFWKAGRSAQGQGGALTPARRSGLERLGQQGASGRTSAWQEGRPPTPHRAMPRSSSEGQQGSLRKPGARAAATAVRSPPKHPRGRENERRLKATVEQAQST